MAGEGVTREGVTGGSPRATLVASVAATESPRPHQLGSEICLFPYNCSGSDPPTTHPSLLRLSHGCRVFIFTDRQFCSSAPEGAHRDQVSPMTPRICFPTGLTSAVFTRL